MSAVSRLFRPLTGLLLIALLGGSLALAEERDPAAPQVSVDFFYPPSTLRQHAIPRLVYEMRISNYVPIAYVLDSIDLQAGGKNISYSGDALRSMMRFYGEKTPSPANTRFDPGKSAIVYFMLDFDSSSALPQSLSHTLHFTSPDGSRHALQAPVLNVSVEPAMTIAPPLRGENWIAGDSVHNAPDAAHRRTIILEGGQPWLAQRYAIDWVKYRMDNDIATTWSGPEDKNSSYLCYDAPIYSVADGTVIEAVDGMPENVPHSGTFAVGINLVNAGGNHLVVDIGNHRYAFYAHMRPGSVAVKVGDKVAVGRVLGHVGNTGSSTEPHLHMHVVDHPSFLAGQGVPYEFTSMSASAAPEVIEKPHDQMMFRNFTAQQSFQNDYPANNAAVTFPSAP